MKYNIAVDKRLKSSPFQGDIRGFESRLLYQYRDRLTGLGHIGFHPLDTDSNSVRDTKLLRFPGELNNLEVWQSGLMRQP